jgi:hypothetical protein
MQILDVHFVKKIEQINKNQQMVISFFTFWSFFFLFFKKEKRIKRKKK